MVMRLEQLFEMNVQMLSKMLEVTKRMGDSPSFALPGDKYLTGEMHTPSGSSPQPQPSNQTQRGSSQVSTSSSANASPYPILSPLEITGSRLGGGNSGVGAVTMAGTNSNSNGNTAGLSSTGNAGTSTTGSSSSSSSGAVSNSVAYNPGSTAGIAGNGQGPGSTTGSVQSSSGLISLGLGSALGIGATGSANGQGQLQGAGYDGRVGQAAITSFSSSTTSGSTSAVIGSNEKDKSSTFGKLFHYMNEMKKELEIAQKQRREGQLETQRLREKCQQLDDRLAMEHSKGVGLEDRLERAKGTQRLLRAQVEAQAEQIEVLLEARAQTILDMTQQMQSQSPHQVQQSQFQHQHGGDLDGTHKPDEAL